MPEEEIPIIDEITHRVYQAISFGDQSIYKKLNPATNPKKDLGYDSLDMVEVAMYLEDEFSIRIPEEDIRPLAKVGDYIDYIKDILTKIGNK